MSSDTVLVVLVAIVMVVGLAGILLPVLPGLWLIWAAALIYALLTDGGGWSLFVMLAMTALAVAGTAATYVLPQRQAASVGVPWWGQLVSAGAAVAGLFVVPVVGAALGFVAGVFAVSLVLTRRPGVALSATWTTLKSMLVASGIQLVVGVVMVATWVIWVIAG
jgi:uncharacterized protein YqgC (DUF456 family)